jgi:hypothetical protein
MIDPHKAIDFILLHSVEFAKAKGRRVFKEEERKTKKALLMQEAQLKGVNTLAAQEREAYADDSYVALLHELQESVIDEESLKWKLIAAQLRVEVWRSENANNRFLDKSTT